VPLLTRLLVATGRVETGGVGHEALLLVVSLVVTGIWRPGHGGGSRRGAHDGRPTGAPKRTYATERVVKRA
jgi:hypothetical protein